MGRGGRAKIENSSRRHPRKFGLKRFLAVRKVLAGKWGGLFLGYLLGKNFRRRDRDRLVPPTRMDAAVCRAEVCYPFGQKHGRHRAVKRREFITLRPYVRPLVLVFFMASSLVAPIPDDSRLNAPGTTQPQFQPPATAPFGFLARFKD